MHKQQFRHNSLICYEVFVQSFRDSNNDGIGDLQGLILKLDYIKDLGANMVWITPIHPSPSYHKYDVVDYYGVHPDFGTMEDMEQLIAELHKRDMLLMMDFVINHTSTLHPWFIASSSADTNAYSDFYVWKDYNTVQDEIKKKETTFDSDNITQWHPGENRNEHYYGFFWKGMPDLNFDNKQVREEIYKIGKFWIDKGVDGFRMDAAKHIYPDDQPDDTNRFWHEFTSIMKSYKADIIIIGEVWAEPEALGKYFAGLPFLFNFELAKAIPEVVNSQNVERFKETYTRIQKSIHTIPGFYANLLSNHDMNRIGSTFNGDLQKSKLAASILLSLPGVPFIYYGEEIGMLGIKPDQEIREPFLWGDSNFQDTSWLTPKHSTLNFVDALEKQKDDPNSLFNHYKKWIRIRHEHPELAEAQYNINVDDQHIQGLLSFKIWGSTAHYLILHNLTENIIEFTLPEKTQDIRALTNEFEKKKEKILLDPYSSNIFFDDNSKDIKISPRQ